MRKTSLLMITLLLLAPLVTSAITATAQTLPTANPILIAGSPIGACYPLLFTENGVYDLRTATFISSDSGERVFCGDNVAFLAGDNIIIYSLEGYILRVVSFTVDQVIGGDQDTIAVYTGSSVKVLTPTTDFYIELPPGAPGKASQYTYTMLDAPLVAYSIDNKTVVVGLSDYVEVPGYGAEFLDGTLYAVRTPGIVSYNIDPLTLEVTVIDTISLSFLPDKIIGKLGDVIIVERGSELFAVYSDGRIEALGYASYSGSSIYNHASNYSMIRINGEWRTVPGRTAAVLPGIAVTTYTVEVEDETLYFTALYPLERAVLILGKRFTGTLVVEGLAYRVDLQPGLWMLPDGSTLINTSEIVTVSGLTRYPQGEEERSAQGAPLNQVVASWPENYIPLLKLDGVIYVSSGGGILLAIEPQKASVLSKYGVIAEIPGNWQWGVAGRILALYDGSQIYFYTTTGNLISTAPYLSPRAPITGYAFLDDRGKPVVVLAYKEQIHVVTPGSEIRELPPSPIDYDALTIDPYNYTIEYAGTVYKAGATPIANGFQAAWYSNGVAKVLDYQDATLYVLVGAPNAYYYPLGPLLAKWDAGTLEVVPFKSWAAGDCYVDIMTDDDATVYVNDAEVGTGSLRIYTYCGATLNIKATKPYHQPSEATVRVEGAQIVELQPKPLTSKVTLIVNGVPDYLVNALTVSISGEEEPFEWRIGEERVLPAMPLKISVITDQPYGICTWPDEPITFQPKPGSDTLSLECRIDGAILAVLVNTPGTVYISEGDVQLYSTTASPNKPAVFKYVPGASITVELVPMDQETYVSTSTTIQLSPGLNEVQLTAPEKGVLIVRATGGPAIIEVYDAEGNLVASGQGSIETKLPPGSYTVTVFNAYGFDYTEVVEVPPGQVATLEIPVPPPPKQEEGVKLSRIAAMAAPLTALAVIAIAVYFLRRRKTRATEIEAITTTAAVILLVTMLGQVAAAQAPAGEWAVIPYTVEPPLLAYDYDGDGDTELVGSTYIIDGLVLTSTPYPAGTPYLIDYDCDGTLELLIDTAGSWSIYRGQTLLATFNAGDVAYTSYDGLAVADAQGRVLFCGELIEFDAAVIPVPVGSKLYTVTVEAPITLSSPDGATWVIYEGSATTVAATIAGDSLYVLLDVPGGLLIVQYIFSADAFRTAGYGINYDELIYVDKVRGAFYVEAGGNTYRLTIDSATLISSRDRLGNNWNGRIQYYLDENRILALDLLTGATTEYQALDNTPQWASGEPELLAAGGDRWTAILWRGPLPEIQIDAPFTVKALEPIEYNVVVRGADSYSVLINGAPAEPSGAYTPSKPGTVEITVIASIGAFTATATHTVIVEPRVMTVDLAVSGSVGAPVTITVTPIDTDSGAPVKADCRINLQNHEALLTAPGSVALPAVTQSPVQVQVECTHPAYKPYILTTEATLDPATPLFAVTTSQGALTVTVLTPWGEPAPGTIKLYINERLVAEGDAGQGVTVYAPTGGEVSIVYEPNVEYIKPAEYRVTLQPTQETYIEETTIPVIEKTITATETITATTTVTQQQESGTNLAIAAGTLILGIITGLAIARIKPAPRAIGQGKISVEKH